MKLAKAGRENAIPVLKATRNTWYKTCAEPFIKWLENTLLSKVHLVEIRRIGFIKACREAQDEMSKVVIRRKAMSEAIVLLLSIIRTARESRSRIWSGRNVDSLSLAFSCKSCPSILFSKTHRILFVSASVAIPLSGELGLRPVFAASAMAKERVNTPTNITMLTTIST